MIKYMQSFYIAAGKWGCYALCLYKVAKKWWTENQKISFPLNETEALILGIDNSYIDFNEDNYLNENNFFVRYPELFLGRMTGGVWNVRKENAEYIAKDDEIIVDFYAKNQENADKGIGHFVFEDSNTLQHSETVAVGKVYSKRVCKKIK